MSVSLLLEGVIIPLETSNWGVFGDALRGLFVGGENETIPFIPDALFYVVFGILIGIVVGALPGLGPPLGMAIMLPLTAPMQPANGIILLIGVYSGAMYGGSIAAVLINAPGVSSSAATTFDGYPMSKQGRAATALSISATASAIAGFVTVIVLLLFSPILIQLVLRVGTPEYFLVAVLGLAMIVIVTKGSMAKGLLAGVAGLLITTIGTAQMTAERRYIIGPQSLQFELSDGISFVAVLIGLFAIAEMMKLAGQKGSISQSDIKMDGGILEGIKLTIARPVLMFKSGFIGMLVGAVPGAGATVSNFIAYSEALRSSKSPETFGEGNEEGVIASEASNNGTVAGSIVPAIAFGIPGSSSTAILIGGLLMHGINPGRGMFEASGELQTTYIMLLALLVGNIIILIFGLTMVTKLGLLTKIDTDYIIPFVIVLSFLGTWVLDFRIIDVLSLVLFGIIGFYMVKYNYSIIAFVLGVVLGDIAEDNFWRSLLLGSSDFPIVGSYSIFIDPGQRLLAPFLTLTIFLILFGPFVKRWVDNKRSAT